MDGIEIAGRTAGLLVNGLVAGVIGGGFWSSSALRQLAPGNSGENMMTHPPLDKILLPTIISKPREGLAFVAVWYGHCLSSMGVLNIVAMLCFRSKEAAITSLVCGGMLCLGLPLRSFTTVVDCYIPGEVTATNIGNAVMSIIGLISGALIWIGGVC
eukprot:TRINITY_DN41586_c0_g1_i1.p1 TRINITY_DN41586_c0_g1~~TRINITY_DN41586_c0_g1_i1.p1  ORF type:complete len:175 (+),score=15.40 TRINITY_DN41586_c0_g1_i1:57-527(+)